ncbi:winged helix-turn-helix domain-containing protein [Halovivax cerinus]|uniref:Transcriptional regulator n=1 Tax=Halovivax cerinus TaxID=1487865 RepID=A0ABD5NKZ2_9EURY|nr:winged helix-turn-helix domain-containing protein [Halovivax cerinus]
MVEDPGDKANIRYQHPSGILYLFQHDNVPLLIDALLDYPPSREFDVDEFAEHAGLAQETITSHLPVLIDVELIEEVPETSPTRYRVADSPVVQELFELNSALNATGTPAANDQ